MTESVTVYGKPHCNQCTATERQLDKVGVQYNYVDISEQPEAIAVIKELGYLAAPVVVAGDGNHWSGFRPEKIAALA